MAIDENKFGLIRTNNGEWISEIHIEILDEEELAMFESLALEENEELDKHYGYYETGEQFVWCYKNDINELLNIYNTDLERFRIDFEKLRYEDYPL